MMGGKVVVMGLGRFGGGVGAARWLAMQGMHVCVTDLASRESLAPSLCQLEDLSIEYHLGSHDPALLRDATLLVISPAVDQSRSEFVLEAKKRNIPITSEMNLFLACCPARIIAVTGSLGKSTTTAMIFEVLHTHREHLAGKVPQVWLGGNIGYSLLPEVSKIHTQDLVVLELSSFQLENLRTQQESGEEFYRILKQIDPSSPIHHSDDPQSTISEKFHVAVLTHLQPHHLDRHGHFEEYVRAKLTMFESLKRGDCAVISQQAWDTLNREELVPAILSSPEAASDGSGPTVIRYQPTYELKGKLRVLGDHHLSNAAGAIAVAEIFGLTHVDAMETLRGFTGLPHRLEFVRIHQEVQYYNDSKSTTVQATLTAMNAMQGPFVLMVGGQDKKSDWTALASSLTDKVRAVIAFGESRAKIAAAIRRVLGDSPSTALKTVHHFNGGINLARRLARPGDAVLFSPGCPSFDAFENYEHRGQHFKNVVNRWV